MYFSLSLAPLSKVEDICRITSLCVIDKQVNEFSFHSELYLFGWKLPIEAAANSVNVWKEVADDNEITSDKRCKLEVERQRRIIFIFALLLGSLFTKMMENDYVICFVGIESSGDARLRWILLYVHTLNLAFILISMNL